jgi:serine protease Do
MTKKTLGILVVVALVGGLMGSLMTARLANAGLWESIVEFFGGTPVAPTSTATSTPVAPYKPTIDYEQAVIHAVESATPSVVSIVISKDVPIIEQCPYDPFSDIPPEFRDFFGGTSGGFTQPCQKGTKLQEVGGGSGFLVSADGLVVTNKHVVSDTKASYTVFTNDGKKYDATVLARDSYQDLAVLRIAGSEFIPVTLGNSDSVKLGQTAIAIGNALGEFRNTVSVGSISGLARTVTASGAQYGSETLQGVIQTDAAINPGNSGGPLLNLKGEVIAVNTAVASGAENIGFAIPVNQLKRAIDSVKRTGSIETPYLGVRYLMITDAMVKAQNLPVSSGALVRGNEDGPAILPDSPAAKAGVQAEDILLKLNDDDITAEHPLSSLIQKYAVGETVTLTVRRGKDTLTLPLVLEKRPSGT